MIGESVCRKWSLLLCTFLIMIVTVSKVHGNMRSMHHVQVPVEQIVQVIKDPLVNLGWATFFGALAFIAKYKSNTHNEGIEHGQTTACRDLQKTLLMRDIRSATVAFRTFTTLAILLSFLSFYNALTMDCKHF